MMKGSWWKILAAVLMIYSIIMGFLMPLKPGILSVSPQNGKAGSFEKFSVKTYNARLDQIESDELRAWLRNDTNYIIQAEKINVLNGESMEIGFNIPKYLPVSDSISDYALIIDGPEIGSFVIPSAIFIKQDSINVESGIESWSGHQLESLHQHEGLAIPFRNILKETLRNTYFHVSLWFSMFILYFASVIISINYLRKREIDFDRKASSLVRVGTLFGMLGIATGAVWAKNTWGTYWTGDVKLNMAAVSMLIYAAYLVLRMSIEDNERRAIVSSSYNIFAFFIIVPLIFVIPRLTDSLHPGNGGNPGFGGEDMDNTMRLVFYPAILGFTLIGVWIAELQLRLSRLNDKIEDYE